MDRIHVFQIELDESHRKVSPEAGFSDEFLAKAYADVQAASRWNNHYLYIVVGGSEVLGVSSGFRPAAISALVSDPAEDHGEEDCLAEAA